MDRNQVIAEIKAAFAERDRLAALNAELVAALDRINVLAQRTVYECDPPVNFIGEINDVANIALAKAGA